MYFASPVGSSTDGGRLPERTRPTSETQENNSMMPSRVKKLFSFCTLICVSASRMASRRDMGSLRARVERGDHDLDVGWQEAGSCGRLLGLGHGADVPIPTFVLDVAEFTPAMLPRTSELL